MWIKQKGIQTTMWTAWEDNDLMVLARGWVKLYWSKKVCNATQVVGGGGILLHLCVSFCRGKESIASVARSLRT